MNKKLILGITALSSLASLSAFFDFDAFDEHFEKMEQHMKKMRKGMKKSMKAFQLPENKVGVSLKEEDDAVVITFAGIKNAEATLIDNDRLSITTPEQRIVITVRGTMI